MGLIVLDTNVVSELMRSAPDPGVRAWILAQSQQQLHTTSVTLAEVLAGVGRLPDGSRKEGLRRAAAEVFAAYASQVLAFDAPAAVAYAEIVTQREKLGRSISRFDAQIAAICVTQRASLATRNVKDFEHLGLEVQDPWHLGSRHE